MQQRFAFYLSVNAWATLGSALYLVSFTVWSVWKRNINYKNCKTVNVCRGLEGIQV